MRFIFKLGISALFCGILIPAAQGADGAHERILCGTNDANEIWCASYNGLEHGHWERITGELKQVIVRDGHLWGVNSIGEIWYGEDIHHHENWVHLQGKAKEISEGHGVLCHVNDKDEIWCADKGITTEHPEWHKAPAGARLKFISVN
jgi:hypothetical protein